MLPSLQFVFPALFSFLLLCTATEILPRAPYAAFEPPRNVELHDVMIARQGGLDLPSALLPRMKYLAILPQERISTSPSSAISKRTLLGIRQSCDPGYGLCDGQLPQDSSPRNGTDLFNSSLWNMLPKRLGLLLFNVHAGRKPLL